MKFKSLTELIKKVKELDTPLYEKDSGYLLDNKEGIYKELVDIINFQLKNQTLIPIEYRNLILWINETNCYVACHWYDDKNDEFKEDYGYSVVTFDDLYFELVDNEEVYFYELILDLLRNSKLEGVYPLNTINIYESDEMDEPTLLKI